MQPIPVPVIDNFLLCCPPPEREPRTSPDSSTYAHSRKRRVFVVDDERMITDTLAEILTDRGFDVIPFYDSRKVIAEAQQLCPDVLVTDVIMPYLNGVELATRLSELCPETRVLLLSGQAATAELLKSVSRHGKRFELLSKPLDPRVLLKKIA
jgi:FixJ family two-component response regulator